jgi:hypothetical protein
VSFVSDDMDGGGNTEKVQKGSAEDKKRSRDRKQDRQFREMSADFGGIADNDDY